VTATLEAELGLALGRPVSDLERLSGGTSRETWRFVCGDRRLILRRDPETADVPDLFQSQAIDRDTERLLIALAGAVGVPVPRIEAVVPHGYVMECLAGETIPRRILRDPALAEARTKLAGECGRALAGLQTLAPDRLPPLPRLDVPSQIAAWRDLLDRLGEARPVFELAMTWLEDHRPAPLPEVLVHGDFRLGNLMIGPFGLVGVLDWELAHLGDPAEDLGWLCVRSWRFGAPEPVAGVGRRVDLLAAFGGGVDAARLAYFEVFGTLRWGMICLIQVYTHLSSARRSLELAAIGRRVSETEYDLLNLIGSGAG